jgi:hypothetical protein
MTSLTIVSIVLALAGLWLCVIGLRRLFARRPLSALNLELSGLIFLVVAAASFVLSSNLYLYNRLDYEAPVAEIQFTELSPQHFTADLQRGEVQQQFDMWGDEWQLDAQMLVWHGFASAIGLDPQYRLHRLSGRYTSISDEREKRRSVYALSQKADVDLWLLASQHQGWFSWLVDASYGSAVYLPMSDKAIYQISISRTGLISRPMNAPARKAVSRWIGL